MKPVQTGVQELYDELVDFVADNYDHKVVEVGVGHRMDVAEKLKALLPTVEVIVTDNRGEIISLHAGGRVRVIADDVFMPVLQAYRGASLIYSLNPPPEMVPTLEQLAVSVGADLLVKPISDEQDMFYHSKWERVIRRGRTVGWLLHTRKMKGSLSHES